AAATGTVVPLESRRRSWRSHPTAAGLGAAASAAALITAVAVGSTLHSPKHHVGTNSGAGINPNRVEANAGNFPTQISDQTYTPTTAKDLLAGVAQAGLAQSGAAGPAGVQTPMTATAKQKVPAALQTLYSDHAALLRCAAALAGPNSSVPIAVDFGYFTDPAQRALKAPAVVILLPGPVGKIDAWIVGPNCATAADNNFYFFQRISQPS
ncbi:MAG: hypothetical protein QOF18_451, partial [Frankiaceae bacterium]|nr:hypothetical protein [Frankiaceae bacterium]